MTFRTCLIFIASIVLPAVSAHAIEVSAQRGTIFKGSDDGFHPIAAVVVVPPGERIMVTQGSVAKLQFPSCTALVGGPQIFEVPALPPCPIGSTTTVFQPNIHASTAATSPEPTATQSGSIFGGGTTNTLMIGGLAVGGVGAALAAIAGSKDDKPSSP